MIMMKKRVDEIIYLMTKFLFFLILPSFILFSCQKDENNPPAGGTVTANAGQDQSVDVGSRATLSAAGSTIPASAVTVSYFWVIDEGPAGSNATLDNPFSVQTTFTPDLVGDYTIILNVSADGQDDADTVMVKALAAGSVRIVSNITEDQTWTDHNESATEPDYIVESSISIQAVLTIEPGVLIQVAEGKLITVDNNGTLISDGQQGKRIVFTSSNAAGDIHWDGLRVTSADSRNVLNYTDVSYGGDEDMFYLYSSHSASTNVGIDQNGRLTVTNSTFTHSKGTGLAIKNGGELKAFSGNTFSDNGSNAVEIDGPNVSMMDQATVFNNNNYDGVLVYHADISDGSTVQWGPLSSGTPYRLVDRMDINGELTIAAGVRIEVDEDYFINVNEGGVLMSKGTSADPVVLTSSNVAGSIHWGGIRVKSSDSRNALEYTTVSWAGGAEGFYVSAGYQDYALADVQVENDARIKINNCTLANSEGAGLILQTDGEMEGSGNNSFNDNAAVAIVIPSNMAGQVDENTSFSGNGMNAVEIYKSEVTDDQTWVNLNGDAYYYFVDDPTINAELTIDAGAELRFGESVVFNVDQDGTLIASGTSSDHIVFTTADENQSRYWGGIQIISSSTLNELSYVDASYGGGYEQFYMSGSVSAYAETNIGVRSSGKLQLMHCTVSNSSKYGLAVQDGGQVNGMDNAVADVVANVLNDNTFENNGGLDVVFQD